MLMFLEVFIFLPLIIGITDDQVLLPWCLNKHGHVLCDKVAEAAADI